MPDGKRKRRYSSNTCKKRWYAQYRSARFCRRFAGDRKTVDVEKLARLILDPVCAA